MIGGRITRHLRPAYAGYATNPLTGRTTYDGYYTFTFSLNNTIDLSQAQLQNFSIDGTCGSNGTYRLGVNTATNQIPYIIYDQDGTSPPLPDSIVLFSGSSVPPVSWLGGQEHTIPDSAGISHRYHSYAVANTFNRADFKVTLQRDGVGSRLLLAMPSGGDPNDENSGGSVQALIPFGLTVGKITGANISFGTTKSKSNDSFWSCEWRAYSQRALQKVVQAVARDNPFVSTIFTFVDAKCLAGPAQRLYEATLAIDSAGDLCNVNYPIINDTSIDCLTDTAHNNALYGEPALNTHQTRQLLWKPVVSLATSQIIIPLAQSLEQTMALLQVRGMTIYLSTPVGDLFLDNFR